MKELELRRQQIAEKKAEEEKARQAEEERKAKLEAEKKKREKEEEMNKKLPVKPPPTTTKKVGCDEFSSFEFVSNSVDSILGYGRRFDETKGGWRRICFRIPVVTIVKASQPAANSAKVNP